MIITNKKGLPKSIVKAVEFHKHTKADYSATEILNDPKLIHLRNRHDSKITVDVVDQLFALMGQSTHYVLDAQDNKDALTEESMLIEVDGIKLSGRADYYEDEILDDYKLTSLWTIVYGSRIKEWTEQLNIYAYMFYKYGFKVSKIRVIALLRDWSKTNALRITGCPDSQVEVVDLELWDFEKTEQFIKERLAEIQKYKDTPDDEIPPCSIENRWKTDDKWAVIKDGNKKATKVCDTEAEAVEYVEKKKVDKPKEKYNIDFRKGIDKRCHDYCEVNQYCNYYKSLNVADNS
jgi:hypothetical protein